jgi:TRAP-type C4-dicarboxylate transport system permease small subunit
MGRDRWHHQVALPETFHIMTRIVVENLFVFLLPTFLYVGWVAFRRNDWPGLLNVLKAAPLIYLFVAGAVMMLTALLAFSSRTGHRPGEGYVPPSFEGGTLSPGHSVPTEPAKK